jgi:hypothetical protein
MLLCHDKTGFPLLVVEDAGVEAHLLPVTKLQFEQFIAETNIISQNHYQEMLALNAVTSPHNFSPEERERLFVTGILPDEALAFARWLGDGFDLPTAREWREVYAALRRVPPPRQTPLLEVVDGVAKAILERFSEQMEIRSLRDYALMEGGLVEWVRHEKSLLGLGAPRPEFHANLWDPLVNEIKPIRLDQRIPYFGFRLVRRGKWFLADSEQARYLF